MAMSGVVQSRRVRCSAVFGGCYLTPTVTRGAGEPLRRPSALRPSSTSGQWFHTRRRRSPSSTSAPRWPAGVVDTTRVVPSSCAHQRDQSVVREMNVPDGLASLKLRSTHSRAFNNPELFSATGISIVRSSCALKPRFLARETGRSRQATRPGPSSPMPSSQL
jgi:hypothetical protein